MALEVFEPPNNKEDTKMKTIVRTARLALPILVALSLTLVLGVGLRTAFSGEGPKEILGFGEAKAAPFNTFHEVAGGTKDVKSFGKKSLGAIGDTVGNRITFAFGATKDAKGNVQGQIFLRDHALNLTISSDVTGLVPHPKHRAPVGVKARGLNYAVRMESSTSSVVVNGKPQPGWRLRNGPAFDGDKDAICFGLFNPDDKKVYQWSAFLSAGDVKTR